jgi:hypothetical protein
MISKPAVPRPRAHRTRVVLLAALVPAVLLTLVACGSSATTPSAAAAPNPAGSTPAAPPGVVGRAAAVTSSTLQVQNTSGQVTVDFSTHTRITAQRSAALRAVTVGDCLTATGTPAATGTGLTARTVAISAPTGGSCTANRGGFGTGARRSPFHAAPSPNGTATATGAITGTVTAKSASTITVNGILHDSTTQAGATPAARQQTVTVDAATRYTTTTTVPATALKVGTCVAARGPSNDLGTVQATSISVFPAGPNGCVMFGNRGTTTGGSGTSNG